MIRERVSEALASVRSDIGSLTKAGFWVTLGSMATLFTVAPEATLTRQLLPLEVGLLVGMDAINAVARNFGMGSKTGIDLVSERSGLLMDSATYEKKFEGIFCDLE